MAASGIDVGEQLVPADQHNQRGYFEDVDFLELNRRILVECCDENDGGHPDWGWTESESLDDGLFERYRDEGRRLLEKFSGDGRRRGFKDPRSSLLLDFWHGLLDDARYLLVYRLPWEVADSMQRLGADVFLRHPEYALRIWAFYNRRLLDFYRRHPSRCLLVSTNALLRQPDEFADLLLEKLDVELDRDALEELYEASLLASSEPDDPLVGLVAATSPEVIELLQELDQAADLPAGECWRIPQELKAPAAPRQPQVSVVIPCRDHGQFLIEAVASVERSIESDYELIIVDDGSEQERTLFVLDRLREAGYRIVRLEGQGLSAARNRGFNDAHGEFVVPLDADNRLRKGFVEAALEIIDTDPEIGSVYGEPWEFGQRQGRRSVAELDIDQLLAANYIDACSLVRKAMWWDIGGYDEALPAWEDWDFWIRVAARGWKARRLETIAFDYRVRPDSLVSITQQEEVLELIVDRVTSKHRQLFHGFLAHRLGHALAAWPRGLERGRQRLADEAQHIREQYRLLEEHQRRLEKQVYEAGASEAELRLQLERERVERLEAERLAERHGWQVERARMIEEQARGEVELRESLLAKMQEQIDEQHRQLEDRRLQIEERQKQWGELHRQFDQQNLLQTDQAGHLAAQQQRLLEQDSQLSAQQDRLLEQEGQLSAQQDRLLEQEGQLSEQQDRLLEQEDQLSEQQDRLLEQEGQLSEQDSQLSEKESRLASLHARLVEQEALLTEKENRLAEQHALLMGQDAQLKQMNDQLAQEHGLRVEKEGEIDRLSGENAELQGRLTAAVAAQEARLRELESEISRWRGEAERERLSAAERQEVLDKIHSSRAFRWLQWWWRLASGKGRRRNAGEESSVATAARSPVEDGVMGG